MGNYFDLATNRNFRSRLLQFKRNFILDPSQWNTLNTKYTDFNWQELKFSKENVNSLKEVEGIYIFCSSPKQVNAPFVNYFFYIGETDNLKRRFTQYLNKEHKPKTGQYKVFTIIDDYPENLYFFFVELPGISQTNRRLIEDDFLIAFMPPINSKYPQGLQSIILSAYGQ